MKCQKIQDYLYGMHTRSYDGVPVDFISPFDKLRLTLHLLNCPVCSAHKELIKKTHAVIRQNFFEQVPSETSAVFADSVMEMIYNRSEQNANETVAIEQSECLMNTIDDVKTDDEIISIRAWIITGVLIFLSLFAAYFGVNLLHTDPQNIKFLLYIGLTVGGVITAYSAIFIGSHLQELSAKFGIN
ncbi:MAG: hypothetical protein Ta2F_13290 [Termitinemataceae bacterium]|nr:MAG: hypothetical protein Ta2F_13290 [Termitinemataceae bacterium]